MTAAILAFNVGFLGGYVLCLYLRTSTRRPRRHKPAAMWPAPVRADWPPPKIRLTANSPMAVTATRWPTSPVTRLAPKDPWGPPRLKDRERSPFWRPRPRRWPPPLPWTRVA